MSGAVQFDLFDNTPEKVAEREQAIEVVPTREILVFGDRHAPEFTTPPPLKGLPVAAAREVLYFAESARRYNQAGVCVLDCSKRDGAGSNGPIGNGSPGPAGCSIMSQGSNIHIRWRGKSERSASVTWAAALAALQAWRDAEPAVARARDLAEGYHYLDYYGHVYGDKDRYNSEEWRPEPLIERIAREVIELGGDPSLLQPKTKYMAEGVRRALAGAP